MQQINLYLPEFRPNREPFRALQMVWVLLFMFVFLVFIAYLSSLQLKQLEQELQREQQTQVGLQAQLQAFSKPKSGQSSADLDAKIQQLQKELQKRNQVLELVTHQNLGNDKGFSAYLNAMANASLSTLSLETFSLQQGGAYAEFGGRTRRADQVPLYLQKLRENESFARVKFGILTIEQDEKNRGLLQFTVAKADEEALKKKPALDKH